MLSHFSSFLLDIVLFAATVALSVYYGWTARDLLWSLWISSLTVGYCSILAGIGRNLVSGSVLYNASADAGAGKNPERKKLQSPGALMAAFFLLPIAGFFGFSKITLIYALFAGLSIGLAVARYRTGEPESPAARFAMNAAINLPGTAFLLCFFTIHFGGFHFVHSIFLNGFFPLTADTPFGKSIEDTFDMFLTFISVCIVSYWPFIVTSAAASASDIKNTVTGRKGDIFLNPYKNVIKMHLMIFIIAFMGAGGLKPYILYAALVIYFFPFGKLFAFRRKSQELPEGS